jgi:acyl dehydratase
VTAVPGFEKTFRSHDLMAYGAATWDWFSVHYDQHRAEALGFPGCFVDGQNFGALFAKQAMDWSGPRGFISAMSLRYRAMVFVGDSVVGSAEVSNVAAVGDTEIVTLSQIIRRGDTTVATCTTTLRRPVTMEGGSS